MVVVLPVVSHYVLAQPSTWDTWGPPLVAAGATVLGAGLWRLATSLGRMTAVVSLQQQRLDRLEAVVFPTALLQQRWERLAHEPPKE